MLLVESQIEVLSSFSNPFFKASSRPEAPQIQVSRRQLRSYDVDAQSRLSLPALLRHLHDTAQDHASGHGFGFSQLQPFGLAWALVGLKLDWIAAQPLLRESPMIECSTRVSRFSGPVVYRHYEAASSAGIFVSGMSMWALIDLNTRTTATPPPELKAKLEDLQTGHLPFQLSRLKSHPDLDSQYQRMVQAHDCDFNGHLNNVMAVTWMLDGLMLAQKPQSDQEHLSHNASWVDFSQITSLHLTYIREALWGQNLHLHFDRINGSKGSPIRSELRQEDGSPCVLMDVYA